MKNLNLVYIKRGFNDFTESFNLANLLASAIDFPDRTAVTLNIRGHQIDEFVVRDFAKACALSTQINQNIDLGNDFSFLIDFDS
jgi:hypothetical protein